MSDTKIYVGGSWITPSSVKVYQSGSWTNISAIKIYQSGSWVQVWPSGGAGSGNEIIWDYTLNLTNHTITSVDTATIATVPAGTPGAVKVPTALSLSSSNILTMTSYVWAICDYYETDPPTNQQANYQYVTLISDSGADYSGYPVTGITYGWFSYS